VAVFSEVTIGFIPPGTVRGPETAVAVRGGLLGDGGAGQPLVDNRGLVERRAEVLVDLLPARDVAALAVRDCLV
jgi:hypothetical protein